MATQEQRDQSQNPARHNPGRPFPAPVQHAPHQPRTPPTYPFLAYADVKEPRVSRPPPATCRRGRRLVVAPLPMCQRDYRRPHKIFANALTH
jgi:hypothetical protein